MPGISTPKSASSFSPRLMTVPTTTAEPSGCVTKTKFLNTILFPSFLISASCPSVTFFVNRVVALDPAPHQVSESASAAITSGATIVRRRISNLQIL